MVKETSKEKSNSTCHQKILILASAKVIRLGYALKTNGGGLLQVQPQYVSILNKRTQRDVEKGANEIKPLLRTV